MASSAADVPLLISSDNASSERRVSPSWTIAHLKGRLEPITGIPASCQRLSLKFGSQAPQPIEAADEETTLLTRWSLQAYAEIHVSWLSSLVFPSTCLRKVSLPRVGGACDNQTFQPGLVLTTFIYTLAACTQLRAMAAPRSYLESQHRISTGSLLRKVQCSVLKAYT